MPSTNSEQKWHRHRSNRNDDTWTTNMAPPATNVSVQQQQTKRKRKVPLKHQDYFNGKQADEDDDDLKKQMLFKAVKIEYTMPDGRKNRVILFEDE
uniref:ChSh domain-containing protein n=1 Tax=Globodera pallida TaxID=36090 RepID=A0A183BJX9_GLOPA